VNESSTSDSVCGCRVGKDSPAFAPSIENEFSLKISFIMLSFEIWRENAIDISESYLKNEAADGAASYSSFRGRSLVRGDLVQRMSLVENSHLHLYRSAQEINHLSTLEVP
jgi:hypothetical protein